MKQLKKFLALPEVFVVFLFLVFSVLLVIQNSEFNNQMKAKNDEIFELRGKINNYLISSGAYSDKTVDTLPLLKNFGIIKVYND